MSYARDIKWLREHEKSSEHLRNNRNRYAIGNKVTVRPEFGRGLPIDVTITDYDEEGENGRPIFCYQNNNGDHYWAYTDQIV
jgi:hypothetical protein